MESAFKAAERSAEATGKKIEQAFSKSGRPIQTAANGIEYFIDANGRARNVTGQFLTLAERQAAGLNSLGTAARGAAGGLGGLAPLASGFAGVAASVTAVAAAVAGIGFAATKSAGQIQKLTAAFTGLTGSAEAAAKLRQSLFDLGETTPFKNEEILQTAQRFLAVGINVDSLNGSINRIGALAAQSGQPLERLALIYAQVYAKGRLQGEENLQFLEAGVDLTKQLTQVTGLSGQALRDAMSKGKISIADVNAAIILATGEMKALELAGRSVDTQFNNIFDKLGQLFGGFAQGIAPALSAAFKVINDIFKSAFPDLDSIAQFFAPLTEEAQRFAQVLGESPGVIEVIAAGIKNIAQIGLGLLVDGITEVRKTLESIDQKAFIQGFINAEIAVRRILLAASALALTLNKTAELQFRAFNLSKFGADIVKAGGFSKFIEKEYRLAEQKWKDWANSEPLKFPDLTGQGAKQADKLAGDLDNKLGDAGTDLTKKVEDAAKKLRDAAIEGANAYIQAIQKLTESRLQLAELRGKPEGLNRFLSGQEQFDRTRSAIISLGPELNQALEQGASLLRSQGVGIGRELFGDLRAIFDNAVTGRSANQEGLLALTQFIRDVQTERGAEAGVNQAERDLAEVQRGLITSNVELREAVSALVQKDWNVQVNLNGATGASVIGDVAGALG
jgi:tape measure domain-containing protein